MREIWVRLMTQLQHNTSSGSTFTQSSNTTDGKVITLCCAKIKTSLVKGRDLKVPKGGTAPKQTKKVIVSCLVCIRASVYSDCLWLIAFLVGKSIKLSPKRRKPKNKLMKNNLLFCRRGWGPFTPVCVLSHDPSLAVG